ncbi:MAG: hypothetical protein U0905_01585 [Pirellulales bacterium]
MKKYALFVGCVLLAFTGCGRGWLPCLHRGAPCYNGTCHPEIGTVGVADGCNDCGTTVGYESYPGSYSTIHRGESVNPVAAP